MRFSAALASAAAAALLFTVAPAAYAGETAGDTASEQASADESRTAVATRPRQWFKNQATGQCLDDSYKYGARATHCWKNAHQHWYITVWRDGTRELENVKTGRCLAVDEDWPSDDDVVTQPCNESEHQSWYVTNWADGTIAFRNQATGDCLDHNFTEGLHVQPCNEGIYQSWY